VDGLSGLLLLSFDGPFTVTHDHKQRCLLEGFRPDKRGRAPAVLRSGGGAAVLAQQSAHLVMPTT
jgi:hypothetical protein